jgi:4-hydroxybenzoate polyprenyltransferase
VKGALDAATERWKDFFSVRHYVFALSISIISMMLSAREARGWPGWKIFFLVPTGVVLLRICSVSYEHIVRWRGERLFSSSSCSDNVGVGPTRTGACFFAFAGAGVFLACSAYANSICLSIAALILVIICFYPRFQRMSDFCTLYPGIIYGLIPLWSWIAATGTVGWVPFALGIISALWIGGLSVLDSIRTLEYDQSHDCRSLAIRWGSKNVLAFAFLLHLLTVMAMAVFGFFAMLKIAYIVSVGFITLCILIEHWIAKIRKKHWLGDAFFRLNLIVSIVYAVAAACEMVFPLFNFSVR